MAESKQPETPSTEAEAVAKLRAAALPEAPAKPEASAKPKGSAKPKTSAKSGRARRALKSVLGVMPLILTAWLLSAMAASAGAPRWLAGIVAALPLLGPPAWHFWAERRRKKAGKPDGALTRHDRWLMRAGAALGIPLVIILVFFRGAAWDAIKSEGLWFAKAPPKSVEQIAIDQLRHIPTDARAIADLSGVDPQAKTFVAIAFGGSIPVYGNQLPLVVASGASQAESVFLYDFDRVSKALGSWTTGERRGRKAWIAPGDSPHVAFRSGDTLLVATEAWVDAVADTIESAEASASGSAFERAAKLRGNKKSIISFMAHDVQLTSELKLEVGYVAWAKTKNGIVLRGAATGTSEQRKAIETALAETYEARREKFPVLKKLKLETKTSGDVVRFSLRIPNETLAAILLQPGIFSFR